MHIWYILAKRLINEEEKGTYAILHTLQLQKAFTKQKHK